MEGLLRNALKQNQEIQLQEITAMIEAETQKLVQNLAELSDYSAIDSYIQDFKNFCL